MKTIFKNFSIRNAICIEEADLPLDNQGVVLIKGENLDEDGSNGSGKSSIFELLSYACVGENSKSMSTNELLNLEDPTNLYLGLSATRDHDYKIEHFRAHSIEGTKIRVSVDGIDKTPDVSKTSRKAPQLFAAQCLNLTPREVYGSVYIKQNFSHAMINGKPSEKRSHLSSYFGLDTLDTLISTTTKRLKGISLQNETDLLDLKKSIEEELDRYNTELKDINLENCEAEQKAFYQRIITLHAELEKQRKAAETVRKREVLENELRMLALSFDDDLDAIISMDTQQISECNIKRNNITKREQLEKQLLALGAQPDVSYDAIITELDNIGNELLQYEQVLEQITKRNHLEEQLKSIPTWDISLEEVTQQVQGLQSALVIPQKDCIILTSELEQLKKVKDVCYTCLRPLAETEKQRMIDERLQKVSVLSQTVAELQDQIKSFSDVSSQIDARLTLVNSISGLAEGDKEQLVCSIQGLKTRKIELSQLAQKFLQINTITTQLNQLPVIRETVEQIQSNLLFLAERVRVVKNAYSWFMKNGGVVFDLNKMSRLQGECTNLEAQYVELTNLLASAKEKAEARIRLQKQLQDVETTLAKSSTEKNRSRILEVVHFVLNDVRQMKLRESVELLTQVLPANIHQLYPRGNVGIEITDEAGELDLFLRKGKILVPMKNLSGGQAKRVGIAIIFAFAKMGSKLTNLLLADEIFKDLDKGGRLAAYELMMDLKMETMLVTSHDDDVGVDSRYDQVWTIRMENGKSRLYI